MVTLLIYIYRDKPSFRVFKYLTYLNATTIYRIYPVGVSFSSRLPATNGVPAMHTGQSRTYANPLQWQ